jgi:hypothetical protein
VARPNKDDLDGLRDRIQKEAKRAAERYTFDYDPDEYRPQPGVFAGLDDIPPPPPPFQLPDGLCWQEYHNPPASEVANGYCYGKERYIYGRSGVYWNDWEYSQFEPGGWPRTVVRGAEYFVVWLYKDAAK